MKKKLISAVVILCCAGLLIVFFSQMSVTKKAETRASTYYSALMNRHYSEAFDCLYIYDDFEDVKSALTREEAMQTYLKKAERLESHGYKMVDFQVTNVDHEDFSNIRMFVEVTIETTDGKQEVFEEQLHYLNNKILIVSSEDPLYNYRNGKMNVTESLL